MINKTFGRLTVLKRVSEVRYGHVVYECICFCGVKKNIAGANLRSGKTKSCGCLQKEKIKQRGLEKTKKQSGINSLYNNYRMQAKRRNLEFSLDLKTFSETTSKNCSYCGDAPQQKHIIRSSSKESQEINTYVYNGLDRIDNTRGYISDNILPCCKLCNYAKYTMDLNTFLNHIRKIYKNCRL